MVIRFAKGSFAIGRTYSTTNRNGEGCGIVGGYARKRRGRDGRESDVYEFLENPARTALSPGVR
jgi:hypothetical protein